MDKRSTHDGRSFIRDRYYSVKTYTVPAGSDPRRYMQELSLRADALCRESDFHGARRLLQKRLAVVSHYLGSRTYQAAQCMAQLAAVTRQAGIERDANTWAYYAFRAFATLLMDEEARHKRQIVEGMAALEQRFPDLSADTGFQCIGFPDFTSGQLRYPPEAPTAETLTEALPVSETTPPLLRR